MPDPGEMKPGTIIGNSGQGPQYLDGILLAVDLLKTTFRAFVPLNSAPGQKG